MKQKLILLFLLITSISFAQPGMNPNDGNPSAPNPIVNPTSFNRLKIPLAPKKLSATRVMVQDSITKELGWVLKSSLSSSVPTLQQVANSGNQINSGSYSTQLTAGDLSLSSIFDGSDLDPFSLTFYKSGNSVSIKPPTTVTGTYGVFLPSSSGTLALLSDIPSGSSGTVSSVTGISPITVASGTTTPVIGINQATTSTNGYLSSTDWNTFNNKQSALGFTPEASISSGTTSQYWRGDKTWQTLPTYTLSGLGGAPIASPTFTGTVSGITSSMVGLGNVDNTSDVNKPLSTATQTALNLKLNTASPSFTGILTGVGTTLTGSANTSLIDLSQTWNTPTGVPSAIKLNITNTQVGIGAKLLDFQVSSANRFSVDYAGNATLASTLNASSVSVTGGIQAGFSSGLSFNAGVWSCKANALSSNPLGGIIYTGYNGYAGGHIFTNTTSTDSQLATTNYLMQLQQTFAPTTNTGTYTTLRINPTINQTGTANGITRGILIDPIITSAANFRALDITNGSIVLPYATASTTYAVKTSDYLLNFTTGTFTATLPTAVGCTGKNYILKNSGTGAITIATTSSQTIDLSSTYPLGSQNKYVHVVSDGANWIVTANN